MVLLVALCLADSADTGDSSAERPEWRDTAFVEDTTYTHEETGCGKVGATALFVGGLGLLGRVRARG